MINVSFDQAKKISRLRMSLGLPPLDRHSFKFTTLNESKLPSFTQDNFKLYGIQNPNFFAEVDKFYEQYKLQGDWYRKANEFVFGAMSEADACLFLLFLGIFSAQTEVGDNFNNAVVMYVAFMRDLKYNTEKLRQFGIEMPSRFDDPRFKGMSIPKAFKRLNLVYRAFMYNLPKAINLYFEFDGNLTRDIVINRIEEFINYEADRKGSKFAGKGLTISNNLASEGFLRVLKVPNFVINLLVPEYTTDRVHGITLDLWMGKYFNDVYPDMNFADSRKFSTFDLKNTVNYLFASEQLRRESIRIGVAPSELQSTIWTGVMDKARYQTGRVERSFDDKNYYESLLRMSGASKDDTLKIMNYSQMMKKALGVATKFLDGEISTFSRNIQSPVSDQQFNDVAPF